MTSPLWLYSMVGQLTTPPYQSVYWSVFQAPDTTGQYSGYFGQLQNITVVSQQQVTFPSNNTPTISANALNGVSVANPSVGGQSIFYDATNNLFQMVGAPLIITGIDTSDTTDVTAAIQASLTYAGTINGGATVYLPAGLYRINGTLVVPSGVEFRLDAAAQLHRHSGGITAPLVRLTGNKPKLNGAGQIKCDVAPMPRGMVLVGPNSLAVAETINWATVEHVHLLGTQTPGDGCMGIWIDSSEPTAAGYAGTGNNYQGTIIAPIVQGVDEAVHFDQAANAWQVYGVQGTYIGRFLYRCHSATGAGTLQATENAFHGGFVSHGGSMTSVISCENAGYQLFYGVHGEPGAGKYYQIDANCGSCQVHGHNNAVTASTDAGVNTIVTSNGASSSLPTGTGNYLLANGNVILPKVALGAGQYLTIGLYGSGTLYAQIGTISAGALGGVWLGPISPTVGNFALFGDGTSTTGLNVPTGGTNYMRVNNVTVASFSAAQALLGAPVKLAGQTLATSATAGSSGDVPAQVNGYLEMVADFGSGPVNIRVPFYNP